MFIMMFEMNLLKTIHELVKARISIQRESIFIDYQNLHGETDYNIRRKQFTLSLAL